MAGPSSTHVTGNPLTRRRFLVAGGIGGGALALGGALFMRGGGTGWYASLLPEGLRPRALSPKALAVLHVFCDAVVGALPAGEPSAKDARLAERIDRELDFNFPRMARDIESALLLVEHGALKRLSFDRFTRMSADQREAHLERLADGSELERQAFSGLRFLAMFFFYCDDRTWKGIHYEGPLLQVRKPPDADSNPLARGAARG